MPAALANIVMNSRRLISITSSAFGGGRSLLRLLVSSGAPEGGSLKTCDHTFKPA
jgi:hypothetical protein